MNTIDIGTRKVKLVKSKRSKYMRLSISSFGEIKLSVPLLAQDNQIINFLQLQSAWMDKVLAKMPSRSQLNIVSGEKIKIAGIPFELELITGHHEDSLVKVDRKSKKIYIFSKDGKLAENPDIMEKTKGLLRRELIGLSRSFIQAEVEDVANKMGLLFKRVSIREQKSRWGSCSNKGNLNFNWKITLAPENVMRYVVVHEVAHLKEHNHSNRFWQLVAKHHPSYEADRLWLKQNGVELEIL